MVDYSRFDHIGDSDSEEEEDVKNTAENFLSSSRSIPTKQPTNETSMPIGNNINSLLQPAGKLTPKGTEEGRLKFEHEGKTIYEWEQSLEEVNLYIKPPPGVPSSAIDCEISHQHLKLGLKGNPPFIDEDTGGPVKVDESYWMLDGGEININLQKMNKAETWTSALVGRGQAEVDPITKQEIQKKMMLERFQEENPGFDFSGADFNGMVPDPREFMGGVRYR
eukprot:CAMPEP_0117799172 /NCGR_PEP_ID=MMETSP0948-20121206/13608_1 /TAXON_ID=44440 /ORGANISM="Chattonella subsalsa, Strain CCMP2191" /LENGTH=221 /DNA_ID=CAMNT_0005630993 /DNA_START=25 /DNA_END=690 /DNA_ORIENTATION=-